MLSCTQGECWKNPTYMVGDELQATMKGYCRASAVAPACRQLAFRVVYLWQPLKSQSRSWAVEDQVLKHVSLAGARSVV